MPDAEPNPGRIVVAGEALVDLICPEPVESLERASHFEPHSGGAPANAAVAAARAGAEVAFAGTVGGDGFGRLIRERLDQEGVALDLLEIDPRFETPFALVALDQHGVPEFTIRGIPDDAGLSHLGRDPAAAVAGAGLLVLGSNTLVERRGAELTIGLVEAATEAGVPVALDLNLRPSRWGDPDLVWRRCRETADLAAVVKGNVEELGWLTGSADAPTWVRSDWVRERADSHLIVATDGGRAAIAVGTGRAKVTPETVADPLTLGAGDAFTGAMLAGLLSGGWDLSDPEPAIAAGCAAAAAACRRLGAID